MGHSALRISQRWLLMGLFLLFAGCGGGGGGGTPSLETPAALLSSAWSLFEAGNLDAASQKFDALTKRSDATASQKSEGFTGLGLTQFRLQMTGQSLVSFDSALNLVPTQSMAKVGKAEVLIDTPNPSNLGAAQVLLQDVLSKDPNFSFPHGAKDNITDVYALLSLVFLLQENFSSALDNASIALNREPSHPVALKVMNALAALGVV